MKKIIILLLLLNNFAYAFHDTEVENNTISALGGLWTQIFVYEQECTDNQYYNQIIKRLNESPRFKKYSQEVGHLSERQELAWERGGLGAGTVIASGGTDCNTMATVIWEWFGVN